LCRDNDHESQKCEQDRCDLHPFCLQLKLASVF
jgi:hypothetical protein